MNKREDKFEKLIKTPRKGGDFALDLGAGDGTYSLMMQEANYAVNSVDQSPKAFSKINDLSVIKTFTEDITKFEIVPESYDLIIARNVFPFITKEEVKTLIKKIAEGLRKDGQFAFTLFGQKDDWAKNPKMSFFTHDEILPILEANALNVVEKEEYIGEGFTMNREVKNWHIHTYITVKKSSSPEAN